MIKAKITQITANLVFVIILLFYPLILGCAVSYQIFKYFKKANQKSIAGHIAVVTGGAHGLGKEICLQLAKLGCHIAVVDINGEEARNTAQLVSQSYNVRAKSYRIDVTRFEEIKSLNINIIKDLGAPATILVNNAGCLTFSNITQPDHREVQRMIDVNMTSHYWTIDAFLPNMKAANKGHIVAISSIAGLTTLMYNAEYSGTKFGVRALMRTLRLELKCENFHNIGTSTVFPSFLATNQNVVDMIKESTVEQLYPLIPGQEAAKRIVRGILCNEENIYLPEFCGLAYRLLDFLPSSFQDCVLVKLMGNKMPTTYKTKGSYQ